MKVRVHVENDSFIVVIRNVLNLASPLLTSSEVQRNMFWFQTKKWNTQLDTTSTLSTWHCQLPYPHLSRAGGVTFATSAWLFWTGAGKGFWIVKWILLWFVIWTWTLFRVWRWVFRISSSASSSSSFSSSSVFPAVSLGFTNLGWDVLCMWPFFNPKMKSQSVFVDGACWVCICCWHSPIYDMNIRNYWGGVMECMCAQTSPWFILPSKRVLGEWRPNPSELQGKNPLYQRLRGLKLQRCIRQDSEPNALPTELFWPLLLVDLMGPVLLSIMFINVNFFFNQHE